MTLKTTTRGTFSFDVVLDLFEFFHNIYIYSIVPYARTSYLSSSF